MHKPYASIQNLRTSATRNPGALFVEWDEPPVDLRPFRYEVVSRLFVSTLHDTLSNWSSRGLSTRALASPSALISGLQPGTTYQVRVTCCWQNGRRGVSRIIPATTAGNTFDRVEPTAAPRMV